MTIKWAGHTWDVRSGSGDPGPNNWSDSPNNVWVDAQNNLHLKITNNGGKWFCASINTTDSVGHGTYTINMVTNPSNPALDNNTVIGLFYWLDPNSELDIEYARWNDPNNTKYGQYSVQGSGGGASPQFHIDADNTINTMVWFPNGNINFETKDSNGNIIGSWNYTGPRHAVPGGTFVINLWLFAQTHPSDNIGKELILSGFTYSTDTTHTLTSIAISPASASVNINGTTQLTATCKDQNNNTMICPSLTWTSSDTTKVAVSPTGLVTGITPGIANITAKSGQITSNISAINVTQITPVLTSIAISPALASVNVNGTIQLTATCKDQNNNTMTCPTLTWASSDTTKVTVNLSGLVTGIATGIANITAKYEQLKLSSGTITSNISVITVMTISGSITVTAPTTGLVYKKGESRVIRWKSSGTVGQDVKIELIKTSKVVKTLTSKTPNDGQMAWTIPGVTSGTDYQVKITSVSHTQIFGISGKFTIK